MDEAQEPMLRQDSVLPDKQWEQVPSTEQKDEKSKEDAPPLIVSILAGILGIGMFIFFSSLMVNSLLGGETLRVNKDLLKSSISKALSNEADLRAIKQIHVNREVEAGFSFFWARRSTHYPMNVPLSTVLEDMRADFFLGKSPDKEFASPEKPYDKAFISRLDKIIAEYSQTNPFDNLESSQKESFERLRDRLGDQYLAVQNDVTKIADELYKKNQLTQEYLRNSTISFWVSVGGLLFSLVVGSFQIYQNRSVISTITARLTQPRIAPPA